MSSAVNLDNDNPEATRLFEIHEFHSGDGRRIREFRPVKEEDGVDPMYQGLAMLNTPSGPSDMSFPIPAADIDEAVMKFPEAAQQAVDEIRNKNANRIVVPNNGNIPPQPQNTSS